MYASSYSKEFNTSPLINFSKYHDADDVFVEVYKVWQKIDLNEKKKLIDEVKSRYAMSFHLQFNSLGFYNHNLYSQDYYRTQNLEAAPNNRSSEKYLTDHQNSLSGIMWELSYDELKRWKNFENLKFYFWVPEYWKSDKMKVATKISKNWGIIKTNLNDVDYIIINEGLVSTHPKTSKTEQFKLFNYMMHKKKQQKEIIKKSKITENINSLQNGSFKSRIMKLVEKNSIEDQHLLNQAAVQDIKPNDYNFTSVFEFLCNNKWKPITMNDLNDVMWRHESLYPDNEFYKKRLKGMFEDTYNLDYKSFLLIAAFRPQSYHEGANYSPYQISYHQFDKKAKEKTINEQMLDFFKLKNPILYTFHKQGYEVPILNRDSPIGTSVFQTKDEYDYGLKKRQILDKKYKESISQLYNVDGGIGKDCTENHPEQKPAEKHCFCFLCKIEFEDYFQHVYSEGHKNSIYLQKKAYDKIDQICDDMFKNFKMEFDSFSCFPTRESTPTFPIQPLTKNRRPQPVIRLENSLTLKQFRLEQRNKNIDEKELAIDLDESSGNINGEPQNDFGVDMKESSNAYSELEENARKTPLKVFDSSSEEKQQDEHEEHKDATPVKSHISKIDNHCQSDISASKGIIKEWDQQDSIHDEDCDLQAAMNIGKTHEINNREIFEFSSDSDNKMNGDVQITQEIPYDKNEVNFDKTPIERSQSFSLMNKPEYMKENRISRSEFNQYALSENQNIENIINWENNKINPSNSTLEKGYLTTMDRQEDDTKSLQQSFNLKIEEVESGAQILKTEIKMMEPFQQPYSRDLKDSRYNDKKRKHKNRPQYIQAIKRHSKVKKLDQIKQDKAKKAVQKLLMKDKEEALTNYKGFSSTKPSAHRYANSVNISSNFQSKRQKLLLGSEKWSKSNGATALR